jgi:hypothetical protein
MRVSEEEPTVFCAWCRRVMRWGEHGISHGLCETCLPEVTAEIEARLTGERQSVIRRLSAALRRRT